MSYVNCHRVNSEDDEKPKPLEKSMKLSEIIVVGFSCILLFIALIVDIATGTCFGIISAM